MEIIRTVDMSGLLREIARPSSGGAEAADGLIDFGDRGSDSGHDVYLGMDVTR